jgi:hypothetical protein
VNRLIPLDDENKKHINPTSSYKKNEKPILWDFLASILNKNNLPAPHFSYFY